MRVTACHAIRGGGAVRGVALLSAAVASAVVLTAAAVAASLSGGVPAAASGMRVPESGAEATPDAGTVAIVTLALGPLTRQACPATAAACVDLTIANAHYYNEHLPIGTEVVVF
jgi:hypothetical protein